MVGNSFRLSANAFERPPENVADAKSVIFISAEGTCTEPDYFGFLNDRLSRNCPFVLHALQHKRDTASDPKHVLELLEECRTIRTSLFAKTVADATQGITEAQVRDFFDHPETLTKSDIKAFRSAVTKMGIDVDYYRHLREIGHPKPDSKDRFVLVLDRDAESHTRETLVEILDACRDKHIEFCLSNPCFDLWLLLHLEVRLTGTVKQKLLANEHVSKTHTYSCNLISQYANHAKSIQKAQFDRIYLPKMRHALKRARTLATSENDVLDQIGTRIPVLINQLLPWL